MKGDHIYNLEISKFTSFPCKSLILDLCDGHGTFGNGMDHGGVSSGKLAESIVIQIFR